MDEWINGAWMNGQMDRKTEGWKKERRTPGMGS